MKKLFLILSLGALTLSSNNVQCSDPSPSDVAIKVAAVMVLGTGSACCGLAAVAVRGLIIGAFCPPTNKEMKKEALWLLAAVGLAAAAITILVK